MALSIPELKEKIKSLTELKEFALAAQYQAQLTALEAGRPAQAAGSPSSAGKIIIQVSPEDFEKAGSKFARPGLHESIFGMPYWEQAGVSLSFPFTICLGANEGIESKISTGADKKSAWKIKEILTALGVAYESVNGMVAFDPADVAGKQGATLWSQQRDTRTEEEGYKGTVYTKAISVHPSGSTLEGIGVTMSSLLIK